MVTPIKVMSGPVKDVVSPLGSDKALKGLIRLFKDLIRPLMALEGPHEALKGLIRPLGALYGPERPSQAIKSLIRPQWSYTSFKGLRGP